MANCPISRPNCPTAGRRDEGDTRPDHDDRLDDARSPPPPAGHPPREQVGQRAQQRGDQQADEHRDRRRSAAAPAPRTPGRPRRRPRPTATRTRPRPAARSGRPRPGRTLRSAGRGRAPRSRSTSRHGGCGPDRGTTEPRTRRRVGGRLRPGPGRRPVIAPPASPLPASPRPRVGVAAARHGSVALIPFLGLRRRAHTPIHDRTAETWRADVGERQRALAGDRVPHRQAGRGVPAARPGWRAPSRSTRWRWGRCGSWARRRTGTSPTTATACGSGSATRRTSSSAPSKAAADFTTRNRRAPPRSAPRTARRSAARSPAACAAAAPGGAVGSPRPAATPAR